MSKGTDRIYGMYDHCNPSKVAYHEEIPIARFDHQQTFLDYVVKLLKDKGRNIFISKTTMAISIEAYERVPTIRERQGGIKGKLRDLAFRILDIPCGPSPNLRRLGSVLYQLGDDFSNVQDIQVKECLELADKKFPYNHTTKMPFGTPL